MAKTSEVSGGLLKFPEAVNCDDFERWQILMRPRGWRAYRFAEKQLSQHGLKDWTVAIATSRQVDIMMQRNELSSGLIGGLCVSRWKTIGLTPTLMLDLPWHEVEHTVLHEIAHALVGRDGHGKTFLAKCHEIMPAAMYAFEFLHLAAQRAFQRKLRKRERRKRKQGSLTPQNSAPRPCGATILTSEAREHTPKSPSGLYGVIRFSTSADPSDRDDNNSNN